MDAVDRAILDALRANARATYAELAREVGLSAPAVHERVNKLEAQNVITGYHAAVAPESLGDSMTALVNGANTTVRTNGLLAIDMVTANTEHLVISSGTGDDTLNVNATTIAPLGASAAA